ncbi:MAG: HIT domain-containing protein [Gaiellaceae bacterium]
MPRSRSPRTRPRAWPSSSPRRPAGRSSTSSATRSASNDPRGRAGPRPRHESRPQSFTAWAPHWDSDLAAPSRCAVYSCTVVDSDPLQPVSSACEICAQIAGDPRHDALHALLGGEYRRRVILETEAFAVLPSLGPLVEGHVLICPKIHTRRFADMDAIQHDFDACRRQIQALLDRHYDGVHVFFEHGAGRDSEVIPCTVDHAHIHVVPLSAVAMGRFVLPDLGWVGAGNTLAELNSAVGASEYLALSLPRESQCLVATGPPGTFPSQLLRRAVAAAVGRPHRWNWRVDPEPQTVGRVHETLAA